MPLAFLRDKEGNSPAREEWRRLSNVGERNLVNLLADLYAVASVGKVRDNPPLSHSVHIGDDLYWLSKGNIGVLYSYDGNDLVIINVTAFTDENEGRKRALQVAEQRI
jgi:hypothetical protein